MENSNLEQQNKKIFTNIEIKRDSENLKTDQFEIELIQIKCEPTDETSDNYNKESWEDTSFGTKANCTLINSTDEKNNVPINNLQYSAVPVTNQMVPNNNIGIKIKQEPIEEEIKEAITIKSTDISDQDGKTHLGVVKIEVDVQRIQQNDDCYASSSKLHDEYEEDRQKLLEDVSKIQFKLKKMKSQTPRPKRAFPCDKCSMSFSKKDRLTKHLTVHLGLKHSCDVCQKEFSSKHNMLRHKHVHYGVKPYSCDHCAKSFMEKTYLVAHLRTHFADKLYKCSVCSKEFRERAHLIRHERIHSGERPYTCEVCHKNFKQSAHLSCHRKIHKKKVVLYCDMCKQGFLEKEDLYEHHKVHIGEKAYSCDVCHRQFSQSSHLNDHVRIHNGKRPFDCPICNKPFSQRSTLNRHIKIHSGEKPFACPVCHKRFKQKTHVTKHVKLHEKDGIRATSPVIFEDALRMQKMYVPLSKRGRKRQQIPPLKKQEENSKQSVPPTLDQSENKELVLPILPQDGNTSQPTVESLNNGRNNAVQDKPHPTINTEVVFIKTEPI